MKDIQTIPEVRLLYVRPALQTMPQVESVQEVIDIVRSCIDPHRLDVKEFFWIILLTHSNHVLGISEIAIGDVAEVTIHKKEIFQLALTANAKKIIMCHNHPSGNLSPSQSDISLTKDIIAFGNMIDINILDHLVLTSESYYSFTENGLM